jgi:hypothetical protein
MALESTQPLREMRADNLTTFMCLNLLEPYGPVHACIGIAG